MIDPDYLRRRGQELGLERYETLVQVQHWLDERYPEPVRALSFNRGVLKIVTPNASMASELRMQQDSISEAARPEVVKRVQIVIGTIT